MRRQFRAPVFRTMLFRALVLFSVGFLALAAPAYAQDSGLSFLRLGTDAAALARGDAGVASSTGASATYWNPAGLASVGAKELGLSHHVWIADVRTYAFQSSFPLGKRSGVGFFVIATGSGDLESRQTPGESEGVFQAQFVSSGLSYARSFGKVKTGMTVKYLSERIFSSSANGYAFDFGVQSGLFNDGLLLGASFSNLGKMEKLNVEATQLPRIGRAGVELFPFRVLTETDGKPLLNTSVIVELSRNFVTEESQLHVGVSGEVLDTVTARVGYLTNDALRDFSAGLGIEITELIFDYALLPFEDGFGGPAHILTLTYSW
ncbi:MAG: PorV/PorQ family protein [Bacteroidetes Order II. Incertae sedis bacterium]|jgi:hypothetical protein|nr:PorV/PorQ family protein [Bacteroidetes Order II. bacterium]MBT4603160.1 PorV/PorQ family protein [Bacteroidetes Order II. bacterium]MBT5250673.1 PorV/PorQ family protein [Bacteroidetes Order II. bacterium]MBT6201999.1 PorV/PorQ family protein [Bacteroidetes Order II. bacterium]MBT6425766.1 PorV/PorQ family protein [Bacteroidetes Order II. bacterium]